MLLLFFMSSTQGPKSSAGLWGVFLINVCDFVMVCSKFMLLLFFMSSGRNQCWIVRIFVVVCYDSGHVLELS
jgi:hypothetical protein